MGASGRSAAKVAEEPGIRAPPLYGGSGWQLDYDYQYAVAGRANGPIKSLQLNDSSTYRVTYAYDAKLRLARVGSENIRPITPIDYAYVPNSNLVDTVMQSTGSGSFDYKRDCDYETTSNRAQAIKHSWGASSASQVETRLTYGLRGLRETEKTKGSGLMAALARPSDGVNADYVYTDRSEIDVSARSELDASWGVGASLSGTGRDYDYDAMGNRVADHLGSYAPTAANAYSATPYDGGSALSYDENGNLLTHGSRTFSYDGENRLVSVAIQGGSTSVFKYDYLGRRISKTVGNTETRFVYDGWNLSRLPQPMAIESGTISPCLIADSIQSPRLMWLEQRTGWGLTVCPPDMVRRPMVIAATKLHNSKPPSLGNLSSHTTFFMLMT